MSTISEIEKKIEQTRNDINKSIDEMNAMIHEKLNITKKVGKASGTMIFGAALLGFAIASLSTKTGIKFLGSTIKPATAIGTAYLSKQAMKIVKEKVLKR